MPGEVVDKRGEQLDPASPSQSSVETELSELFLRFSTGASSVKGFSGLWTFYRADSAEDDAINSSFRCLRTYETLHTDPVTIKFRTFNQMQPGNGVASARPQDGVFESDHSRLATDPFFSDNMILSEAEQSEGLPECVFWRCVAVDAQNVLRVAPRLPPSRAESSDKDGQPVYPGWSQQSMTTGVFAFESFLEDGDNRWSLGALYSVSSLRLLSHFCIQEHAVTLDPSRRISFGSLPAKQPKSRLSKDVSSWLDQGSYKGEMQEVIWDEEGEMLKLPTRPAHWSPPDTHSTTHRLFLYPDGMYAYYPCQLPETSASSPNTFNQGARFEMGGLCKENQEFRRLILRYSPAGQVTSLTKELYKASGSFEFEKRQSTSVRRSLDIRRPHTPPGATALSNHARATARAAKLDQAFKNSEETA